MSDIAGLVNKGTILHRPSGEPGRIFIVTGLERSGTSLVAAMLYHAGVFMGSEINDAVYQDEAFGRVLAASDGDALHRMVAACNARYPRWGFKRPLLHHDLSVEQLGVFDGLRVIVTVRDPVAMAVRVSLSEYQEPMRALSGLAANQMALLHYIDALRCPTLLASYEKILAFPSEFADALLRFCGVPTDDAILARLIALVEPNRPNYLAVARRQFDGLIDGVRDGQLYGWCCLTQSAEPVTLEVLVDDRVALTVVADAFRGDLLDAGFGQGRHGFFVPLGSLHAQSYSVIRVRVARHNIELPNSGTRLSDFGTAA
ncbi:MAG TPA: hypothetical protein VFL55_26470 [Acetobacteraceae bacterium]|nr:hypothetical protein [Acetobacteraceae bacterium]